jgi:lipase ATG15
LPIATKTSTTPTSTLTCKTPGWFGCNDPTTSTLSSASPTATCETPGRVYGCYDQTTSSSSSSTSCLTPGYIWGCKDETTTATQSHAITSPPAFPTPTSSPPGDVDGSHCVKRSWFGWCKEWSLGYELKQEI